ncbi:MAG TPA: hypothetical protein DDY31_09255 [Lachnospiraceae bacterium]|nr:hypothetical protein [Lachnospiraceae bacterium]
MKTKINLTTKQAMVLVCALLAVAIAGTATVVSILSKPEAKTPTIITTLSEALEVIGDEENFSNPERGYDMDMDAIIPYTKEELVIQVTAELGGSSTRKEFLEAYLKKDSNEDLVEEIIKVANKRAVANSLPPE